MPHDGLLAAMPANARMLFRINNGRTPIDQPIKVVSRRRFASPHQRTSSSSTSRSRIGAIGSVGARTTPAIDRAMAHGNPAAATKDAREIGDYACEPPRP